MRIWIPMEHIGNAKDVHTIMWVKGDLPIARCDSFYDHVSYKENTGLGMTAIGRWLGVSHKVCRLM